MTQRDSQLSFVTAALKNRHDIVRINRKLINIVTEDSRESHLSAIKRLMEFYSCYCFPKTPPVLRRYMAGEYGKDDVLTALNDDLELLKDLTGIDFMSEFVLLNELKTDDLKHLLAELDKDRYEDILTEETIGQIESLKTVFLTNIKELLKRYDAYYIHFTDKDLPISGVDVLVNRERFQNFTDSLLDLIMAGTDEIHVDSSGSNLKITLMSEDRYTDDEIENIKPQLRKSEGSVEYFSSSTVIFSFGI